MTGAVVNPPPSTHPPAHVMRSTRSGSSGRRQFPRVRFLTATALAGEREQMAGEDPGSPLGGAVRTPETPSQRPVFEAEVSATLKAATTPRRNMFRRRTLHDGDHLDVSALCACLPPFVVSAWLHLLPVISSPPPLPPSCHPWLLFCPSWWPAASEHRLPTIVVSSPPGCVEPASVVDGARCWGAWSYSEKH